MGPMGQDQNMCKEILPYILPVLGSFEMLALIRVVEDLLA